MVPEQLGDQILHMCEETVKLSGPNIRSAFSRLSNVLNLLVRLVGRLQLTQHAHEDDGGGGGG